MEREIGVSRCKLLYLLIQWIDYKVLLSSTGKYIQYPRLNHNGKSICNMCACMLSPCSHI